ncbi:MAG: hypothetical protein ACR2L2_06995 [Acidobacteriota bacterium]
MSKDKLHVKARTKALERFPGAWGNDYDPEDKRDRWCLDTLIRQELESLRQEAPADA